MCVRITWDVVKMHNLMNRSGLEPVILPFNKLTGVAVRLALVVLMLMLPWQSGSHAVLPHAAATGRPWPPNPVSAAGPRAGVL